ncbi:MAG: putative lipid II flippase FtsW, partial [Candidatus Competibacteraceae bacterium]|nr:putative lipid II flippase FtsW [Candidatus Competibacteraceae bacterium]
MNDTVLPREHGSWRQPWRLVTPDPWLLLPVLGLLVLGLVIVASASMPVADRLAQQPLFYFYRQSLYVVMGLVLGFAALQVPLASWYHRGPWLLALALGLLVLVLVPGIGREVNGSRRWIDLGVMNVQVSEVAKLLVLIYTAGYLRRHLRALKFSTGAMLRPMAVMALVGLLLLAEPDFGAAAVLTAVVLGMMFLAGVHLGRFLLLQGGVVVLGAVLIVSSPYRLQRLLSYLDPFADPFNTGFQLTQSLIAIGRGEMTGVGLGASVQKLFYLPEAYTDFVFAVLAEETGLLGIILVVLLYGVLVWRAFAVGARAEARGLSFAAFLAYGIGLWFALQSLINMGVNMGLLPTKGLTLPLISYGGSSMVAMCLALGVLMRVEVETREPPEQSASVHPLR